MAQDWAALHQIRLASPAGWTFWDEEYLLQNVPTKITRGVTEAGEIRPGQCTFRIQDAGDEWRPSNPAGPHYGDLRQYMQAAAGFVGAGGGSIRFTGEVASFKPDQSNDHAVDGAGVTERGVRWVDFDVQDPLRRVGQWDEPLESAMRHQISGYADIRAYFPLEDASGSERLLNLAEGGRPGYLQGSVSLAGADGPAGSGKVLQLGSAGLFGGSVVSMPSDNTGWQVFIHVKTEASPPSGTHLPLITWNTSDGSTWTFSQSSGGYRTQVISREGATLYTQQTTYGTGAEPGQWITFRIKVTRSGSTVTVETGWNPESDLGLLYGYTGTYSGGVMRPTSWRVSQNANNANAAYGHIGFVYSSATNLQEFDFRWAFQGYRGERARSRFVRLLGQAGLSWLAFGTSSLTALLGPQSVATLMDLLKEIAATDDGLIFGRRDSNAIAFRPRHHMVNTTPLALTYPDQVGGLKEITDDLGVFNDVTVKNSSGGEAYAVLAEGPGSVAAVGRVRKTVDVNVDQSQVDLELLARYYLEKYTVPGPRFSNLTVDLDANPELEASMNALEIGDLITVDGRTPDQLVLRVLQINETGTYTRRTFELVTEPGALWFNNAIYNDDATRADARGHVITGGPYAAGVSPISVNISGDGLAWTHADGNYDIVAAGERMTVTAVAAPSGSTQALTVTRAVNGVAKSLPNGAAVELAAPARYHRGK